MQITEYYFYHPATQGCTKGCCLKLWWNLSKKNVALKWCHVIFTTAFFLKKWWVLSSIYLLKVYISNRPKILSYLMRVKVSWSRSVKQESEEVCFKTRSKTNFSPNTEPSLWLGNKLEGKSGGRKWSAWERLTKKQFLHRNTAIRWGKKVME